MCKKTKKIIKMLEAHSEQRAESFYTFMVASKIGYFLLLK
jgi:hypothetical protein